MSEPAEHPLSVLLFSGFRSVAGKRTALWGLALLCLCAAAVSALVGRKAHFGFDGWPLFFGVFGLASFSAAVLSGWPLGAFLRRRDDYYASDREAAEEPPQAEEGTAHGP